MKKFLILFLFLVVLLVIWTQSTLPQKVSSAESGWIFNLIRPILDFIFGFEKINHSMLRKMAHYMEYGVFGFITMLLFRKNNHINFSRFILSLTICIIVAFFDESIQILSKRGPAVYDIWVDLSGAFVGVVVAVINNYKHRESVSD